MKHTGKRKQIIRLLILALLVSVVAAFAWLLSDQPVGPCEVHTPTETTAETEKTIPWETLRVLPDPYTYFQQGEQWEREAGPYFSMNFEQEPERAVDDYATLLTEQYGLTLDPQEDALVPFGTILCDAQTGEEVLSITWAKLENMRFGMLIFEFADDCTTVPGEVWEGDLSQFRFDEADWVDCETCRGSGECRHCHGRGDVSETDIDGFTEWVDCRRCEDGVCPNPDCRKGKIRIAE